MDPSRSLSLDSLITIFSLLQEEDLLRASAVCKVLRISLMLKSPERERRADDSLSPSGLALCSKDTMALERWSFCNLWKLVSGSSLRSWKEYYLRRSHLEMKMKSGRSSCDYSCKSLRGHKGRVVGLAYLAGNDDCFDIESPSPVVCSASTDGTVKAWDLQKGVCLWTSAGRTPLQELTVDPARGVLFTSDSRGTIRSWSGVTGQEEACYDSGFSRSTLVFFSCRDSAFLGVGSPLGSLLVLSCPALSEASRHVVCDAFVLNLLCTSPDQKWIFAGSRENPDGSPKVFWTQGVCFPAEDVLDSVSLLLPCSGCCAACFLPAASARLALLHSESHSSNTSLSIFELGLSESRDLLITRLEDQANDYKHLAGGEHPQRSWEHRDMESAGEAASGGVMQSVEDALIFNRLDKLHQLCSFQVEVSHGPDVILEASSSALLFSAGNHLKVYTLRGDLMADFQDHTQPIAALCVDSFRVVTASRDLSLRVLTWRKDPVHGLSLEGRYHLLGGSLSRSRGFSAVACDYSSIVASVESLDGNDVLKAYVFDF
ncbi:hypothetical protein DNTS_033845 [Danionella cerebrum]|uniref:F-box domain-containing protein n=1 Tax=Danionella cerebrum TaxID=2873325 RepID=A0A553N5H9_9TELE|nr:hypothetical protein DNTS_033845 [Danionella translucida]